MKIVGIICEYNPIHRGHLRQIRWIRQTCGADCRIVCLMSGNFVQRGAPACFPKMRRAEAALRCGADLVLELPLPYALSSAEGFAAGGVSILGPICDGLCFGAESGEAESLLHTAELLLSQDFSAELRKNLDQGLSFPAARQRALGKLGADDSILRSPNDILGVEYCKAILTQGHTLEPLVLRREGGYHDPLPHPDQPSATSLRLLLEQGRPIGAYLPSGTEALFPPHELHTRAAGERAMLARLRTMTDGEFERLPYGSEGLWRKLMHESRRQATLEEILTAVKSKRYTRSRLDRMVMCAFLGLTDEALHTPVPYVRILGFSPEGQEVLRMAKKRLTLYNVGQRIDSPFWETEQRCTALYGLFRQDGPAPADEEARLRVIRTAAAPQGKI